MLEDMAPLRSTGFTDPGWEHGAAQDGNKKKVKCNYCGKIVSGGIFRLKQHLARISGEVTYCKKAPKDVYMKMKENLDGYRANRKRQSNVEEHSSDFHSNDDHEVDEEPVGYGRKRRQCRSDQSLAISMAPLRSLGYVDPGWEHGVAQDDKKKKVKCNYCQKIVSGGINRFKQHLARIPGEVASCKMAPEDVYLKMKENMKWHRTGRRRRPETKELVAFYIQSDNDEEEFVNDGSKVKRWIGDMDVSCSKTTKKGYNTRSPGNCASTSELHLEQLNSDSKFAKARHSQLALSAKQSKPKTCDNRGHKEVVTSICRFFYYAGIPSNTANSSYFQNMLDLVLQYGQGLDAPTDQLVSGQFLNEEAVTIKEHLEEIKTSWKATGCTIMADTWKDVQGRTIINFLVYCPRGTYFISSIDATDIVDDATSLSKALDKVVEEVGEENVVQVITKNTTCYKAAGRMLEEKRSRLFWTPCAVDCIDQMLEDFVRIKCVGECIEKGQKVTRFIYNRAWLLNLMRKEFTEGRELLKPAATRFATSFITLQSLIDHKAALRRMLQSTKWLSSQLAKSDEGKEFEKIILNPLFWKQIQFVNKSVYPIVNVLKKVDSDEGLTIPSIYNDMYQAKLAIKALHGDEERKYGPFWSVIDNHWSSLFHHPLYVAAYYLNPAYRYRPDFMAIPEVIRGLNECITRLELDNGRRVSAAMQISEFDFAKVDFGTELALSTRKELPPAVWWQQHGINCLELQRIAMRILSQTCSSIGCEHNWSSFDQVYSTKNNHLAQKKLNDLTYVHYNLRLKERQSKRMADDSVSLDTVLLGSLFQDWVIETQKTTLQEDEEIQYNEMEQTEYDNEPNENEDFDTEPKEARPDSIVLHKTVEPPEVRPTTMDAANDADNADVGFIDDEPSD